eukprot:5933853-Pleurochrysis_carterae.AAC.1
MHLLTCPRSPPARLPLVANFERLVVEASHRSSDPCLPRVFPVSAHILSLSLSRKDVRKHTLSPTSTHAHLKHSISLTHPHALTHTPRVRKRTLRERLRAAGLGGGDDSFADSVARGAQTSCDRRAAAAQLTVL